LTGESVSCRIHLGGCEADACEGRDFDWLAASDEEAMAEIDRITDPTQAADPGRSAQ
jgi:hypothetical protein